MATTDKILITTDEVIDLTPSSADINLNTDMTASIYAAQRAFLYPILGECLYEEIVAQAATGTLTTANAALVEQAKVMLAYYALYKYLPYLNYQIREAGVIELQGNNYSRTSDGLKLLLSQTETTAETEKRLFIDWMCDNSEDYPLWFGTRYYNTLFNEGRILVGGSTAMANQRRFFTTRYNGKGNRW